MSVLHNSRQMVIPALLSVRTQAPRTAAAAASPLRQRLVSAGGALAWLQMQQDAGAACPAWDDVIARL